jgi:replicative DNA helicase
MSDARFRCDDVEYALLGAALSDPAALPAARALLGAADFGLHAHATVWQAACDVADASGAADLVAVTAELRTHGRLGTVEAHVRLKPLPFMGAPLDRVEGWARRVAAHARARRVAATLGAHLARLDDAGVGPDEFADTAAAAVALAATSADTPGESWLDEDMDALYRQLEARALGHASTAPRALHSGFVKLDQHIGGLRSGQLYVIAGRTGQGKTALATTVAIKVAASGVAPVLVASLEMTADDMAGRSLSWLAEVTQSRIRGGGDFPLEEEEVERLRKYAQTPLFKRKVRLIASADLTVTDLRARARRMQATHGLSLVIVDYLQLVKVEGGKGAGRQGREREVAEISRGLKRLALELKVPVIALSQLNRAADERETPVLSDIRESGAIEHDATAIVFIWPDADDAFVRVIVAKSRFAPCGEFRARFVRQFTKFVDPEEAR